MFLDTKALEWIDECVSSGRLTESERKLIHLAHEKDDLNSLIFYFSHKDGMTYCPICKAGAGMCRDKKRHESQWVAGGFRLYDWALDIMNGKILDVHDNPAPSTVIIGGPGCGKSTFLAISTWFYCAFYPGFVAGIAAPTIKQNQAFIREFNKVFDGTRGMQMVSHTTSTPFYRIFFHNGSEIQVFTTAVIAAGESGGNRNLGDEYDLGAYDEAGIDPYFGNTSMVLSTRLRGTRPDGTPRGTLFPPKWGRQTQFWVISNPHPDQEQFDVFVEYAKHADGFAVMEIPFNENTAMSEDQAQATRQRVIASVVAQGGTIQDALDKLAGKQNGMGGGEVFSRESIKMLVDRDYDITPYINSNIYGPGATTCFRFEIPPVENHLYIITADPGTAPAPQRNSPAILVWDVSVGKPVLIAMMWGSVQPGEHTPFIMQLRKWMDQYGARALVDTTSAQVLLLKVEDLVEVRERIIPVSFAGDLKEVTQWLLSFEAQEGGFVLPPIPPLVRQMQRYKFDDKKLDQDLIVPMLLLAMWKNSRVQPKGEKSDKHKRAIKAGRSNARHGYHQRR